MEKAYEFGALVEKLKAKGLPMAETMTEESAKQLYVSFKEWFAESAALSKNPFDDMVVPFFAQADAIILPKIDAIDLDGDGK